MPRSAVDLGNRQHLSAAELLERGLRLRPGDAGDDLERAVWSEPKRRNGAEQQQPERDRKRRRQLPVTSRIQPKASGDNMPATAPAEFISALALPA